MARKLKHSKIKNTGILFELLTRQITSDTISGGSNKALSILKKYFNSKSELLKEYKIYKEPLYVNSIVEFSNNRKKFINFFVILINKLKIK